MYQRNQQPNRDNYNRDDDNYDSTESDSSSSDSEAEMEENQEDGENALLPANNNAAPNAAEVQEHNEILERIDFLGRDDAEGDDANIVDDAHPVAFDENSRGNFELPLLGDGPGDINLDINLDIPPSNVNDDSSRESMDMDDETGRPTLGNIIVERNPGSIGGDMKERRDSDEEPLNNFYGNEEEEYCSYMGGNGDNMNNCKCSKCDPKKTCNNCTDSNCCDRLRACYKRRNMVDEEVAGGATSDASSSNNDDAVAGPSSASSSATAAAVAAAVAAAMRRRKDCSSDDDDDIELHGKPTTSQEHCDSKKKRKNVLIDDEHNASSTDESSKENDDSNCGCAEGEADIELELEEDKECTCYEHKLDHVNGHSSKMCLELPVKVVCAKCVAKRRLADEKDTAEASTSADANAVPEADKENVGDKDKDAAGPSNEQAAVAVEPNAVNNIRPRDQAGDAEVARPSKRVKLNNGQAANKPKIPRTIFHKALDAVNMTWDNQHLKNILASSTYTADSINAVHVAGTSSSNSMNTIIISAQKSNFNISGQPLWHEPLSMCAARIDSLRSHGHTDAALRLSISVVRTMKQIQRDGQLLWNRYQSVMNIQIQDDIPKPTTCCTECNGSRKQLMSGPSASSSAPSTSAGHANDGARPSGSASHHHDGAGGSGSSSSSRHKRPYDHSSRSNHGYPMNGYMGPSSSMPHKEAYKMYRYDYGGHSAAYRYGGMGHDGCRRCLEARERANYAHGYHSNRVNIGGSGLPPAFFRSSGGNGQMNHGPMNGTGGNMYDHRFGHFGGPIGYNGRYGNGAGHNYLSNVAHSSACHGDNCNLQHRPHHGMPNEAFNDMYGVPRATCSYDMNRYMGGPSRYNGAGGSNHHCGPNDNRARDLCGPSSSHSGRANHHNCKVLEPNAMPVAGSAEQPSNVAGPSGSGNSAAGSSSSSGSNNNNAAAANPSRDVEQPAAEPQPGCSKDMDKPSEPPAKKPCTQHTKNQCCIKNYCCKMTATSNDNTKCCSSSSFPMSSSCNNFGFNFHRQFMAQSCAASSNNVHRDHHHHATHNTVEGQSTCRCSRPSASSTVTSSGAVNAGASTSKAAATSNPTIEFVRKQKQGCTSNCLDCSVGCDVEFPLDAVACIFDCLTEACIIPDAVNAPDMGRLSFDSVTGSAEDGSIIPPRYRHVAVHYSKDANETYLTLAFEAAVLALGKQRVMPHGLYSQHVIYKQHEQLIQRLRHVDLDRLLVDALKQLTTQLLDGGPSSGLGMCARVRYRFAEFYNFSFVCRSWYSSRVHPHAYVGKIPVHIAAEPTH